MLTLKYVNISIELMGGILCLIIICSLLLTGFEKNGLSRRYNGLLVFNILVLVSDALAWTFKGGMDSFSVFIVPIANFFVYVFGYILLAIFTDYIVYYISMKKSISRALVYLIWGMCAIAVFLLIVSQFNHMFYRIDENNMYVRGDWFWMSQIWAIASLLLNAYIILHNRKILSRRELLSLMSYIVFIVVALIIQILSYGLALLYLATSISALCIYIGIQVEQARMYREKELELERSRTQLMLSQIQPHFLFNSLNAICYLCRIDPIRAEKAVVHFSNFLRGNIESINALNPISFSKELNHLKNYLEIEKIRYGERLHVEYDIQTENFTVPSLTIQTIVENAVRHGIGKKGAGGTVTIMTCETETAFEICVSDDGAGFDPGQPPGGGRAHVGLQNVRMRLERQCRGQLHIQSAPGEGTVVSIVIPKKREL